MQVARLGLPALVVATMSAFPSANSAAAAPLPPSAPSASENLAQPVACWWRNGRRVCDGYARGRNRNNYDYGPSFGYRSYGYSYGTRRPEQLPFGSTEWWRAMDREGRGGYRR